jgi:hypothetical protein
MNMKIDPNLNPEVKTFFKLLTEDDFFGITITQYRTTCGIPVTGYDSSVVKNIRAIITPEQKALLLRYAVQLTKIYNLSHIWIKTFLSIMLFNTVCQPSQSPYTLETYKDDTGVHLNVTITEKTSFKTLVKILETNKNRIDQLTSTLPSKASSDIQQASIMLEILNLRKEKMGSDGKLQQLTYRQIGEILQVKYPDNFLNDEIAVRKYADRAKKAMYRFKSVKPEKVDLLSIVVGVDDPFDLINE